MELRIEAYYKLFILESRATSYTVTCFLSCSPQTVLRIIYSPMLPLHPVVYYICPCLIIFLLFIVSHVCLGVVYLKFTFLHLIVHYMTSKFAILTAPLMFVNHILLIVPTAPFCGFVVCDGSLWLDRPSKIITKMQKYLSDIK